MKCRGSFILFFFFVPVFFIKSKHGWINEGIQGTAFFLGWATSASCSIYESADATHLQQFILLRIGHVLIDSEEHFGSYTLLYAVEYLKRVGYTRLVAPVPYAGSNGSAGTAQALNWGTAGPQRQSADTGYTYTALPAAPAALPAFGRVDTSWFADAAFLGDSLTAGFCVNEYNIDVGGALVCGYEGISPNTVVNRATVTSPDRGEEVPLDVLAAAQPAKLYILIGTNALVQPGNDDSFLAYYGKMLDDLRTALPNTVFYVQSVLPATQEKVADSLPGLAPDRLAVINAAIQQLCAERGCYYLDLSAEFADDAGYLSTEFSQPDGVHLTVSGYSRWVSYLCTHVPYSKDNPYQAGSTYYLSEDMKGLLSDLP